MQKRAFKLKDLRNRIDEYRGKIEELRQSKAKEEMKAEKVKTDIAGIEEELGNLVAKAEEIRKKLDPVKVSFDGRFKIFLGQNVASLKLTTLSFSIPKSNGKKVMDDLDDFGNLCGFASSSVCPMQSDI